MMVTDKKILHTVFDATAEKFPKNIAVVKGSQGVESPIDCIRLKPF